MINVITYGTFDMFHVGHLNLLKRLSELGDNVIVGVSTDEFNKQKGKKVLIPYSQRVQILESIKYVDKVIPEESWGQKREDIKNYSAAILVMGDDWLGKFDDLSDVCDILYLPRTKNISTTEIKRSLKSFLSISQEDLGRAFEVMELLRKDLS